MKVDFWESSRRFFPRTELAMADYSTRLLYNDYIINGGLGDPAPCPGS